VVSALDFRSEGQWFEAQSPPPCCFLRQETLLHTVAHVKPRLHERFFACDGDAIFLKLSRGQRAAKITYVATL